jgi:hypothetical protein
MRMTIFVLSIFSILSCAAGCSALKPGESALWQSNKTLLRQKTDLENKQHLLEIENEQLKTQVETLGSINKNVRLESLYDIQSINIASSTGIFTKEKGLAPQLMVYFSPVDKFGDAVKAAGSVEVELWNIAGSQNEALIHKWQVGPDQLQKQWGIALMNSFYRLAMDLPENMPAKGDFIVRVAFTDYLSGKVLTARKSITKLNL